MRRLWVMTVSDLRQRVREGTVLVFGIVVPLALMFVLDLTIGDVESTELSAITVAASVPEGDEAGRTLVDTVADNGAVEVSVEETSADQARQRARDGEAELALVVPRGFGAAVRQGRPTTVEVMEGDEAGLESDVVLAVIQSVLDRYEAAAATAAAGAQLGIEPGRLSRLAQATAAEVAPVRLVEGEAASEQLGSTGSLVAGQAGLFLLFTVGFGVLGLVIEREQGTLARLRSMPMRPGLIVGAKALTSYILGVAATGVLLTAGSLLFGTSFGSPLGVAVVVLCAVAAAVSLMFVVARLARTAEQANIAQSILAIALGAAGGAFFPIQADGTLGTLLDLNPVAAFIRALGITAGGGSGADLLVPVATMLGFAVVCFAASRLVPDRGAAP